MKVVGTILGVVMAILGVCAFCMPFRTFLSIGWVLGAVLFVNGIEHIIGGLTQKKKDIWRCILGVIYIVVGILILFNGMQRALTDVMLAYMVGFGMIFGGIVQVINGIQMKGNKGVSAAWILCGILTVIFGILSVTHPFLTMISVGYIIGVSVVMQGIDTIILAWKK